MLRLLKCALLILLSAILVNSQTPQEKLEWFRGKAEKPGLIRLTSSQFKKYVLKGPRPYYVFVIFTASGKSSSCQLCKEVDPVAQKLVKVAKEQTPEDTEFPVFFVEIDYKVNRDIFQGIGLTTAPIITMVPKTKNKKTIGLASYMEDVGRRNEYSLMTGRELKDFKGFVEKTTKIKFEENTEVNLLIPLAAIIGIAGLGAAFYICSPFMDRLRKNIVLYALAGLSLYTFCISGGMFNGIRKVPWAGRDSKGAMEWINKQTRNQYVAESYLVGGVNFVAGIMIVGLINLQRAGFGMPGDKTKPARRAYHYCPTFIPFFGLCSCWLIMLNIYTMKNPHYNFGMVGFTG